MYINTEKLGITVNELKENLLNFQRGLIDERDFDFNCCLSMFSDIKNMKFKPYPTRPLALEEYNNLKKDLINSKQSFKIDKLNDDYLRRSDIRDYFDTYAKIESENRSNYYHLHLMLKVMGDAYEEEILKYINDYKYKEPNCYNWINN